MNSRTTTEQQTLSEYNRARTLQYLHHHGIASRAQIAKALHLTPAALSKISNHLLASGAIVETGALEGKGNRRSIGLAVNARAFQVLGVKFARSLIEIGLFDLAGKPSFIRELPTVENTTIPQAIESLHAEIRRLLAEHPHILAIGMAVPGPYLRDRGHTAVVSSMGQWRQVNFRAEFEHAFDVPVIIRSSVRISHTKTPVEAGERADAAQMEAATNALKRRLLSEAQKISDKYIHPPATTDFAIMFLPTEGLYSEAMRMDGLGETLQTQYRVLVAGPSTLCALLSSLRVGFQTLAIQQRSSEVWQLLGKVKSQYADFTALLERTRAKLSEASGAIDRAEQRSRAIQKSLSNVERMDTPMPSGRFDDEE